MRTFAAKARKPAAFRPLVSRAPPGLALRPKLAVGRPGDRYEQEADRVAAQMMGMAAPGHTPDPAPGINTPSASPVATLGGGKPLPEATRAFFEPRFGHSFANVRVFADGRAAHSARAYNARAYTVGRDVVFGAGQYAPGTQAGKSLLAHELTHVAQQANTSPRVQRQTPPKKTPEPPYEVGGDTTSNKIIRIAWTFDDGPTPKTPAMKQAIGQSRVTWFVMFSEIKKDEANNIDKLKAVQASGGEIGIHSYHETKSHVAWFPMSTLDSYSDIATSMRDLKRFHTYLNGRNIRTNFARVPYGLMSELVQYLKDRAAPSPSDNAREIIKGRYSGSDPKVLGVKSDFDLMVNTLNGLGLHLWGGSKGTKPEIAPLSWEAETSGVRARTDNTTYNVSAARKENPESATDRPGKFEKTVNLVVSGGRSRSLIILAHDITGADVAEVLADKKTMEAYAKQKSVRIEYYTLSGLYEVLRSASPSSSPGRYNIQHLGGETYVCKDGVIYYGSCP